MKTLTYNLQNNNYYNDIKIFSDKILDGSKDFIDYFIDDLLEYLKINSNFYKNDKINDSFLLKDELVFELILFGVLWIVYSKKALLSDFQYHDALTQLVNYRNSLKPNQDKLKEEIDEIRGLLGTIIFLDYSNSNVTYELSLNNIDKFISWLETTGEFSYELKAIKNIYNFLAICDIGYFEKIFCDIIRLAKWFTKIAKNDLSIYTINVNKYISQCFDLNINQEDMLFCSRKEVEYHLNMFGAEIMNRLFRKEFQNRSRKAVLLPSCMKINSNKCMATEESLGEHCQFCNNECNVAKISKKGLSENFETYIISHESSAFANATDDDKNELAIIGVACVLNLISGGWKAHSLGIPPQCVILDYVGCSNHWDDEGFPTNINYEELNNLVGAK